jgi:hypothetical protein
MKGLVSLRDLLLKEPLIVGFYICGIKGSHSFHTLWRFYVFARILEPISRIRLGFKARRGTVKKRSIHGSM